MPCHLGPQVLLDVGPVHEELDLQDGVHAVPHRRQQGRELLEGEQPARVSTMDLGVFL
eukprot:CAMPEP_0194730234 /NCGR_PEP_ID=MMETSP0296-20130528/51699_1 /TAXON_ID=39354 /ORGANISM="Heterosigma akashiwo, Strain CCMP2393" /LENGTH=57 /DNA_ID=CAMNT_0039637191 /DNA_START=98 /DNA_END=268 /DNA_ORIENTATION=-